MVDTGFADQLSVAGRAQADPDMVRAVMELVALPREEWAKLNGCHKRDWQLLSVVLYSAVQGLAEFNEYIEQRGAAGLGDAGHDAALEAASQQRKEVRKALGYTYP